MSYEPDEATAISRNLRRWEVAVATDGLLETIHGYLGSIFLEFTTAVSGHLERGAPGRESSSRGSAVFTRSNEASLASNACTRPGQRCCRTPSCAGPCSSGCRAFAPG